MKKATFFILLILMPFMLQSQNPIDYGQYYVNQVNNSNPARDIILLAVHVNEMFQLKSQTDNFRQSNLDYYLRFDDNIKSPQALIKEYSYKSSELSRECDNLKAQTDAIHQQNVRAIWAEAKRLINEIWKNSRINDPNLSELARALEIAVQNKIIERLNRNAEARIWSFIRFNK